MLSAGDAPAVRGKRSGHTAVPKDSLVLPPPLKGGYPPQEVYQVGEGQNGQRLFLGRWSEHPAPGSLIELPTFLTVYITPHEHLSYLAVRPCRTPFRRFDDEDNIRLIGMKVDTVASAYKKGRKYRRSVWWMLSLVV